MKIAPNLLGLLTVALSSSVSLKAEDLPDIEDQIQGEWIAYRGDRFDIRRISEGKMINSYYYWNGSLLY